MSTEGPRSSPPAGNRLIRLLGEGTWGAVDQAIYSLTNLALAILVARAVTAKEFGAFSVIYVAYVISLGVVEAITAETFAVSHSTSERSAAAVALGEAAGCATGLGVALGALAAAAGFVTSGPVADILPVFGLVLPGVLLQNLWRFAFFATAKPRAAVLNDVVWAVAQTGAILVLTATNHSSLNTLILAWGGAGTLAAVVGILQAGVLPRPLRTGAWFSRHGSLSLRFAGEFVLLYGAGYLVHPFLGAVAGLAELAKVRAALVVVGPVHALLNAVRIAVTPVAARLRATEPRRLPELALLVSAGLAATATAWSVAALSLPDRWGRALLGDSWAGAMEVMPAVAVHIVAVGLGFGALVALRAMVAAKRSLRARAAIAVLYLTFGMVGALVGDAMGSAAGLAGANVIGIVLLWSQFRGAYRDEQRSILTATGG